VKRWSVALLSAFVLGILALLFWEFEYQHISLLLWLLVAIALLWCCAWVTISLRVTPYTQQRQTATPTHRRRPGRGGIISLGIALVLMVIGVIFWRLGYENTGQLIGFLVIVALLWGCIQISLLLRPSYSTRTRPRQSYDEPLFPGTSLRSGFYNEGNEKVWDSNDSLPPH